MMQRVEIHIAYQCANKCLFCSEAEQLSRFRSFFIPFPILERKLKLLAAKGFTHLTLTGGEPTEHPDIIRILQLADQMGFRVYIGSNGGRFSDPEFCLQALPLISEISLSLHAPDADLHDRLCQNGESFQNMLLALRNIQSFSSKYRFAGFANIVAVKENFHVISGIIKFASRYSFIGQIMISRVAPEGRAKDNYYGLAVALADYRLLIDSWIGSARKKNIILRFFGVPLCLLGKKYGLSNDWWWSDRLTIERWTANGRDIFKATRSVRPDRNRSKLAVCKKCAYNNKCGGIFHPDLDGLDESLIKPYPGK